MDSDERPARPALRQVDSNKKKRLCSASPEKNRRVPTASLSSELRALGRGRQQINYGGFTRKSPTKKRKTEGSSSSAFTTSAHTAPNPFQTPSNSRQTLPDTPTSPSLNGNNTTSSSARLPDTPVSAPNTPQTVNTSIWKTYPTDAFKNRRLLDINSVDSINYVKEVIKKHLGYDLKGFQVAGSLSLASGYDVVVGAKTGSGKSSLIPTTLMLRSFTKNMIVIAPLKSLSSESVSMRVTKFSLCS